MNSEMQKIRFYIFNTVIMMFLDEIINDLELLLLLVLLFYFIFEILSIKNI